MIGVDITADHSAFGPEMAPIESVHAGACVRWSAMIKVQYTLDCFRLCPLRVAVFCACPQFEGLTEFCFVFGFVFCATLLDFTSRIEQLYSFATLA